MTSKQNRFGQLIILAATSISCSNSYGFTQYQSHDFKTFLNDFHKNPKLVLNQLPPKSHFMPTSVFPSNDILSGDYTLMKDHLRKKLCMTIKGREVCPGTTHGRAEIDFRNRIDLFFNTSTQKLVHTLGEIEEKDLLGKKLKNSPWSDYYWPIALGETAYRYGDQYNNTFEKSWKDLFDYFEANKPESYVLENKVEFLSPAEKYDLLVGDNEYTLTKAAWASGKPYYDRDKKVEYWMGICHGWAPASYMLPRPTYKINVLAADGKTNIPFYPSDIKALASLLWAKGKKNVGNSFLGGRCNTKAPETDENGRIIDPDCFDTNPASWHLVVINKIGVEEHSVIMDATFDYEVWNQPLISYNISYFNPETGTEGKTWKEVVIPIENFTQDKFKTYRNPTAKFIVGVRMQVVYLGENFPNHYVEDDKFFDNKTKVEYRYDLELADNDKGRITGGEWYSNAHPDFLWGPDKNARMLSYADAYARSDWNLEKTGEQFLGVPEEWKNLAKQSSSYSLPMGKIVEGLIERSRQNLPQ